MTAPPPRACDSSIPPPNACSALFGPCSAPSRCLFGSLALVQRFRHLLSGNQTPPTRKTIKPPHPGKQSCMRQDPARPCSGARSASCSASLSNHVSCQKRVPWSNMVTPSFFSQRSRGPQGPWGRGGAGRLPGPKTQSTTMATQRENIRQAVEAGSRARDTDDGSRVLGLRRGRGAYIAPARGRERY